MKVLKFFVFGCFCTLGVPSLANPSGADQEEGWIVRRTSRGLIKVPRKQSFRFQGSDIFGVPNRPSETTFAQRQGRDSQSLIPIRRHFNTEFFGSMGQLPRNSLTNKKE